MAIPAMNRMLCEGVLCSIAIPDKDAEIEHIFSSLATANGIPWYKVERRDRIQQLIQWLDETQPDVVFVMTFPWRISPEVYTIPRLGFLNFHYGLLPAMRGADPIFESIRQSRQSAGLTVHVIDDGLDTGPVLIQESLTIAPGTTYGMLSSQMAWLGEQVCTRLINDISENKELQPIAQDESQATYWPKLSAEELIIRWNDMDSKTIQSLVCACNPVTRGVPASLNGWTMGICEVSEVNLQGDASAIVPGTIIAIDQQNGLLVFCRDSKALKLEVVYLEEGYFPGYKLASFGIKTGMIFNTTIIKQTNVIRN